MNNDDLIGRILRGQGPILGRITGTGTGMRKQEYPMDSILDHLEREIEVHGETPRDIQAIVFEVSRFPIEEYVPASKQGVILPGSDAREILARIPWSERFVIPTFYVWSKRYVYTLTECEGIWYFDALPRNP